MNGTPPDPTQSLWHRSRMMTWRAISAAARWSWVVVKAAVIFVWDRTAAIQHKVVPVATALIAELIIFVVALILWSVMDAAHGYVKEKSPSVADKWMVKVFPLVGQLLVAAYMLQHWVLTLTGWWFDWHDYVMERRKQLEALQTRPAEANRQDERPTTPAGVTRPRHAEAELQRAKANSAAVRVTMPTVSDTSPDTELADTDGVASPSPLEPTGAVDRSNSSGKGASQ